MHASGRTPTSPSSWRTSPAIGTAPARCPPTPHESIITRPTSAGFGDVATTKSTCFMIQYVARTDEFFSMDTQGIIQHLHTVHRYNLIQCTTHCTENSECDPEKCALDHHNDSCFVLPKKFLFHLDALAVADARVPDGKRRLLPTATLAAIRKRWLKSLFERRLIDPFEVVKPEKRRAGKQKADLAPIIFPAQMAIHRCFAAIVTEHEALQGINVQTVVDSGLSLPSLAQIRRREFPECGVEFTTQLFAQLQTAIKAYLVGEDIDECVAMLMEAYPGIVTADLGLKMRREACAPQEFLECSLRELESVYGMTIEAAVWKSMEGSIEGWLTERTAQADAMDVVESS
ncbi:hypothetical protein C8R47DRAFT_1100340 [Mycena vitilis]|nr:hypothetical protein C8R47DRAFT_1100340 [Mycena vitilis]